jgi:hypothetical protein
VHNTRGTHMIATIDFRTCLSHIYSMCARKLGWRSCEMKISDHHNQKALHVELQGTIWINRTFHPEQ